MAAEIKVHDLNYRKLKSLFNKSEEDLEPFDIFVKHLATIYAIGTPGAINLNSNNILQKYGMFNDSE